MVSLVDSLCATEREREPNRNCQPTPRREIVNPIVNPVPAPRRRRVAARGCCDAPVMCAAPRCRVVVVVPSSSHRAWQHLAGNIWRGLARNIWLATFGWQHLAGNIWRGLAGNIWLATFGCVFARRRASSPRRPFLTILLGQSGGGPCEGEGLGSCSDWAPGRLRGSGLL